MIFCHKLQMASYHLSVKIISRSSGRSAIAAASYRSRSVIFDERQGMTFDYSKKHDLAYSAIMLPENAPKQFSDRETLWNAVEKAEKRKDSQISREIEIALPVELPLEKQISLVREFANESFVSKGMIADINIHNKNENPHAHIMLTMRGVNENGFTGKQREWNAKGLVFEWRQDWANLQNEYLAKDGHKVRVDHRSFADMGIDLDPQVKVGVGEHAYGESGDRILDLVQILTANGKAVIENPNIALDYLTKSTSVFTCYDLYKFANAHSYQETQFRQVVDAVLSCPEIVQLSNDKYSTRSIVETEKEMFADAAVLRKDGDHAVSEQYVRQAIANRNLSEDQLGAFSHSIDKSGLSVVIGYAGTGKSYMLSAVKEAYEAEGYSVSGVALAGIAAKNLEESSGIRSTTIFRKLKNWEEGKDLLDKSQVLIVDEAGMVGTNQMAQIVKHVNEAGAKLILVGDDQQTQAIGAGGTLRGFKEKFGYASITHVRRQNEQWQREATVLLSGDKEQIGRAIDLYSSHGFIQKTDSLNEAKFAVLNKFTTRFRTDENRLILAHRNKDVVDLNNGARTLLKESGYLGASDSVFETSKGRILLSENDRIVFLEGNNRLGVYNGTLGTVKNIKDGVLRVGIDDGKDIVFSSDDYKKINHGYAVTVHKSQGATIDKTFILATPGFDKHLSYVSMSRHRDEVNLYYSSDLDGFKNLDHLKASLSRDNSKDLAVDYLPTDISSLDTKRKVSDTIDIMMLKNGHVDEAFDPKEAYKNGLLLTEFPEIGLRLISHHKAIFIDRDIDCFVNKNSDGIDQFNNVRSAILNSKEIVRLDDEKYTTQSLVEAEKQLFRDIGQLYKKNTFSVCQQSVDGALMNRNLEKDQMEALKSILQGSNLSIVHGVAGAGKSYMLGAARDAFEAEGIKTVGVALSGVAARSLQDGSGIESTTIHSKLFDWQNGRGVLDSNHVLVVDEAGMVGTHQMAQVVKHVKETGAKLVLVGDDQQLQAVGAGGPLRGIKEDFGYVAIDTVRRQNEQWQRDATVLLAGDKEQIGKAIDLYSSHGFVHKTDSYSEAKEALLRDWAAGIDTDKQTRLILTHQNNDVVDLNLQAREILKERGIIGKNDFKFLTSDDEVINFAEKDRIVFTKNDKSIGVDNGTLGTLMGFNKGILFVHLDDGRNIEFDEKKYNALSHGYAVTIHKSQGITVDKSYVLASPTFDKHLGYVSLTRHRNETNLYYSADMFETESGLKKTLGRKREKDLIRDFTGSSVSKVNKTEGIEKGDQPEKSSYRITLFDKDTQKPLRTKNVSLDLDPSTQRKETEERLGKEISTFARKSGLMLADIGYKVNRIEGVEKENQAERSSYRITLFDKDTQKPLRTKDVSLDLDPSTQRKETEERLGKEISMFAKKSGLVLADIGYKVNRIEGGEIDKTKDKNISNDRELSL
ncbi:MAG: Ti-type conjugative transfer relaxase TraA [Desulfobulbaceae bacterium]|nr:Ti-type conjugative transfer relaxase TraA [Desulfobulbaceae bacterium]